ncbi:Alpha-1,2-mannosidase (modular protein) [Verrucomicrobia bacterium]|nr:Alpha-1,2-mannosidase (modular protein) [Verrucomicrobiota bacterium]
MIASENRRTRRIFCRANWQTLSFSGRRVLLLLTPLLLAGRLGAESNPVDLPLPMVGTADHGHAYPGATVPFGMVQVSPDTPIRGWDGCSGYHYSDHAIEGFSHTHLSGTGAGCLGDVLLMPTVGEVRLEPGLEGRGYSSRFSHERELATPGYYRVFLDDPKILVELTATARCGLHRYAFSEGKAAHIILDLDHAIGNRTLEATLNVEDSTTVSGSRTSEGWGGKRDIYFVIKFSKPFAGFGIEQDAQRQSADSRQGQGRRVKAFFDYQPAANDVLLVKVGISGTSVEGARKNLASEVPGWDFESVRSQALRQWAQVFSAVEMESFDPHIRNTFYANLYLANLGPVLFNDVDGTYRGLDHKNHPGAGFQNYTTFSLWDTYRAEHPLLAILQPRRVDDMVQSLLAEYEQSGLHTTPIWPLWGNETWCMIGYHSVSVIADAYLRGFHGFDAEKIYQAMRDTAMQDRNGLDTYKKLGYVASKPGEQATSKTIEYTVDDWGLARMAQALGHKDDARLFFERAANYRNLFDGATGFFRGRKADGEWRSPFVTDALVGDEYTEADAWQYAFGVQHDVPGMIALYGGDEKFVEKLDALFTADSAIQTDIPDISGLIGQYSQGDEQCHHVAYLYDYAGVPSKTQQHVRQVMVTLYNDTPAGQCGNVDCGQMSAWYIFSALGFYPVNPVSGIYAIGSPVVTKAVVHLDREIYHGRTFTVLAEHNGAEDIYIQSATLNGRRLNKPWLTHKQIVSGGTLRLVMGPKANLEWGSALANRPPATMPAECHYPPVPAPASEKFTMLQVPIRVICGSDEPVENFVPDQNMLSGGLNRNRATIDVSTPHAAPAAVYQAERYGKALAYTFPVPKDKQYRVRLHFAEIFDDGAGRRVEDVLINGQPMLRDFDIFASAGGMNKAVVKEFFPIAPDAQGNIVIRIASTTSSPDHNAKISGIEILEAGS